MSSLTETKVTGDVFAILGLDKGTEVPCLIYNYDPMCSWCWGFSRTWHQLLAKLAVQAPRGSIAYLAGGLAPDSDQPMPDAMAETIRQHWQRIQMAIPGTQFNFDFWQNNIPRRSTYDACRGVLVAATFDTLLEQKMIDAIATAYYLNAQNPSDKPVLAACAASIGLSSDAFLEALDSPPIEQKLQQHLSLTQYFQQRGLAQGFPSLVVYQHEQFTPIKIDYNSVDKIMEQLNACGYTES